MTSNELEIALNFAASGQTDSEEFYSLLMESDVYCYVGAVGEILLVRHYKKTDGTPYILFFTSIETASEFAASAIGFCTDDKLLKITARYLFEQCPETLFALNLYALTQSGKALTPYEIKSILTNNQRTSAAVK